MNGTSKEHPFRFPLFRPFRALPMSARGKAEARLIEEQDTRREQGLATPIDADNKGFKMLRAMGYEQGQGIGKHAAGRAEPIPIVVRRGRLRT